MVSFLSRKNPIQVTSALSLKRDPYGCISKLFEAGVMTCFWAVSLSIWLHYTSTSGEIRVTACCDQACWEEACKRETEYQSTCESFEAPKVINPDSFKCSWFPKLHVRGEEESGFPSLSSIILHWEGSGLPRPAGGAGSVLWRKLENSHRVERLFTSL